MSSNPVPGAFAAWRIWFFIPNIIGYLRIVFLLWSYAVAFHDPAQCLTAYFTSFVLDAIDGMAARAFDQCSSFGAILDQLVDRAATSGFILMLSHLMGPAHALKFACLIALDVGSHFARMYQTTTSGLKSHKDTSMAKFFLLRWYYDTERRAFMCLLCVGQEMYYLLLYAQHFWSNVRSFNVYGSYSIDAGMWLANSIYFVFPFFALKQIINVLQLLDSLQNLAERDAKERTGALEKISSTKKTTHVE